MKKTLNKYKDKQRLQTIKLLIGRYDGGKASKMCNIDYKTMHYIIRRYIKPIVFYKGMKINQNLYIYNQDGQPFLSIHIDKLDRRDIETITNCKTQEEHINENKQKQ